MTRKKKRRNPVGNLAMLAVQFNGDPFDVARWMDHNGISGRFYFDGTDIHIEANSTTARRGDYIVRGHDGEIYACEKALFDATVPSERRTLEPLP